MNREQLVTRLPSYIGAIHPSLWIEPGPLAVIEFFLSGLPLIALSDSSTSSIITELGGGLLVNQLDSKELARSMTKIESDYSIFSTKASKTFETYFTEEQWIARMNSVLNLTIQGNS
jgi:glycosyltransferase involved in cell wall biosynthesis